MAGNARAADPIRENSRTAAGQAVNNKSPRTGAPTEK